MLNENRSPSDDRTDFERLGWKIRESNDADVLPIPTKHGSAIPMFFARTPISSHGYGTVALRVKLKATVRFVEVVDARCGKLRNRYDPSKTVFYRGYKWPFYTDHLKEGGYLSEFVICDSGVVQSWTYGSAPHLREMANEVEWVKTHDIHEFTGFMTGVIPWKTPGMDGADFDLKRLAEKIARHSDGIAKGGSGLFCAQGVNDCSADHFSTKSPIYFSDRSP